MASSAALKLIRFVLAKTTRTFATTPVRCPTVTTLSSGASLSSIINHPLKRSLFSQPQLEGELITQTDEQIEEWKKIAQDLRDIMNTDDIRVHDFDPSHIEGIAQQQIKSLFEELLEEYQLDPRLTWTADDSV